MTHYVKIIRYLSGETIEEQLLEIAKAGLFGEDLRVFFDKNNSLTTETIAGLIGKFDIIRDSEFDRDNVVFVPKELAVKYFNRKAGRSAE